MVKAHNLINLEGESFKNAIKSDFDIEITNVEKVEKGYDSQVYKANIQDKVVFIRINKNPNLFKVESIGYEIFKKQGIPVPKIIAYKENPPLIGYSTMIMSSAKGTTINEADISLGQRDVIYERIGELLKTIHKTKLEGFGFLKVTNQRLVGEFLTWQDYRKSREQRNHRDFNFLVDKNFVTNEESLKIKKIYDEIALLNFGKASLLHRDVHTNHIFIKGDSVTGIIDLGGLMAGDPRYDIANSLVFQNHREQEHFIKGYGKLAEDPMVNKYLITIVIAKIFFRSKDKIKGNVKLLFPVLKDALRKLG